MTVCFYQPPPPQRAGGIDLAIQSLWAYLSDAGVTCQMDAPLADAADAVVHFHAIWQWAHLRLSARCRARRIPYVVSPHGMLEPWAWKHKAWKKWPYYYLSERRHLAGATGLLATSDMEAASIRRLLPNVSCRVIPLAAAERRGPDYTAARTRLGWKAEERVLVFLSRIHQKKGLHLLLQSLAELSGPDKAGLRLVIIGGGEPGYLDSVRGLADELKPRLPMVQWLGEIWGEAKWAYLQGADLFCLPSYSENFGLAVLEALQVGTPALTTRDCPWGFLEEWQAGYVVEPTVSDVRRGLQAFLQAPPWTASARLELAERVQRKFSWEVIGPRYLELYRGILSEEREAVSGKR